MAEREIELLKRELNMMIVSQQPPMGGGGGAQGGGHAPSAPGAPGNTPTPKKRKGKLREKLLKQKQGQDNVISLPSGNFLQYAKVFTIFLCVTLNPLFQNKILILL